MSDPLEHPTTLRIFLLIRSKGEVGVREVARKLGVKSPSTISWHLRKLVDNDLVEKDPNNQYRLSEKGAGMKGLKIPIQVAVHEVGGMVFPRISLALVVLIAGIIAIPVLMVISPSGMALGFFSEGILLILLYFMLRHWNDLYEQIAPYQ